MDEHVMRTYVRPEPVFVRGEGAVLFDQAGNEYLDFLAGIAVSALGHGHPKLVAALQDQAGKLLHTSNLFRNEHTEAVAAMLCALTGMEAVFFTNSGAEANEAALKLARKWQRDQGRPQRTGFVALEGSFHGRTMGVLSVTWPAKYRTPFEPLIPGVTFVPPGDGDALRAALGDGGAQGPAALILEPIQGETGVRALPDEFLRLARELCDRTGTLLIHDEVQCGSGRTGRFLAAAWAGVVPDVVTLAKPIAAGLPMGACLVRPHLAAVFAPGDHGSTFGGGPFVLRAARVFLDEMTHGGLMTHVADRGAELDRGLVQLQREFAVVSEVRGRGLLRGLRLRQGCAELQQALFRRGLIANCTAGDVLRLAPPFVVTSAQIDRALDLIRAELRALPA